MADRSTGLHLMNLLRRIFGHHEADEVMQSTLDLGEVAAAASAARVRLQEQGLLQVELDAQEKIREVVRRSSHVDRDGHNHPPRPRVAA